MPPLLLLLLSLALSLDFRLVDRFTRLQASRYKDLGALVAATCIAKHFRPRGSSRLRLPTSHGRGEKGVRKGQRVRRVRWPSINSPTPRAATYYQPALFVCVYLRLKLVPPTLVHPAFSRHFIFHSPPPISRQTIHDYALRKSSRLLRTTTRPFSFSISSRGILVRVVSNETKFEGTDSFNFRLKFFISRLSKSCSFSSHEFRRSESRRNFFPLSEFQSRGESTPLRNCKIPSYPLSEGFLSMHVAESLYIQYRFRILR